MNQYLRAKAEGVLSDSLRELHKMEDSNSKIHANLRSLEMVVSNSAPLVGYRPEHFGITELVPEEVFNTCQLEVLWRLLDPRALWTLDQLRKKFGPCYVNTWHIDLKDVFTYPRMWSGFRQASAPFSTYSQHRYGRAFDVMFTNNTAEEARQVVISEPDNAAWQYITELEMTEDGKPISWFHFAVANNATGQIKLINV